MNFTIKVAGVMLALMSSVACAQKQPARNANVAAPRDEESVRRADAETDVDYTLECFFEGNGHKRPRNYLPCVGLFAGFTDRPHRIREEENDTSPARRSIVEYLEMALSNVELCRATFLGEYDDPDNFTVCASLAVGRFLKSTGLRSFSDAPVRGAAVRVGIELILAVGESALQEHETGPELAEGDGDWATGQAAILAVDPCFSNCVKKFRSNRDECDQAFPNPGPDRDLCMEQARERFVRCVGACPTVEL